MRNTRQQFGDRGEQRAAEYLQDLGWHILARNWRCPVGEADLVCFDPAEGALVVVEVKTRAGQGFGSPLEAITYAKVRRLRQLAAIYARSKQLRVPRLRVDAIGVLWPRGQACQVTHAKCIEEW